MPVHDDFSHQELDVMRRVAGLPIDELALAVSSNLWRAAQLFRLKVERQVLRQHDLSFASFSTLFIVWIWGPVETREIARSQSVSKATITSNLHTLERRGLVRRKNSKTDGRLVIVELTRKGQNLIEWIFPKFNQGESEVANTLTEREQETFAKLLRKMVGGLDAQLNGTETIEELAQ